MITKQEIIDTLLNTELKDAVESYDNYSLHFYTDVQAMPKFEHKKSVLINKVAKYRILYGEKRLERLILVHFLRSRNKSFYIWKDHVVFMKKREIHIRDQK